MGGRTYALNSLSCNFLEGIPQNTLLSEFAKFVKDPLHLGSIDLWDSDL